MAKKIIFYELNEVPQKVLKRYVGSHPGSAFAELLKTSVLYETLTPDVGHLSPWITWPTLHRGVNNLKHKISDFGQKIEQTNINYPNYFDIVAKNGSKVGVFGSLHTLPLPDNLNNYCFYVPDTFSDRPDTHPVMYQNFQSLNLYMTRQSGRNVTKGVPFKEAISFLKDSVPLGISLITFKKILFQFLGEILDKSKIVRRRTTQAQIAFDLFYKSLAKDKPDLAVFFTNHVASSMHRYWPACFPNDYESFSMPLNWQNTYKDEIWYTMTEADFHLRKLMDFIRLNNEYTLVIASSMGQDAVDDSIKIQNQLLLKKPELLMKFAGLDPDNWEQKLAMEPQYVFKFRSEYDLEKLKSCVELLTIRDKNIDLKVIGENSVRISFGHENYNYGKDIITHNNVKIECGLVGLEAVDIQDESGSYAYHIPEGILLVYGATNSNPDQNKILTTQIAPSILHHFNIEIPDYMEKPLLIF